MRKVTHRGLRKAVLSEPRLILRGLVKGKVDDSDPAYHESRASILSEYPQIVGMQAFLTALRDRGTYNPSYPLSVLKRVIKEKCAVETFDGVVIAAMLAAGFRCGGNNPEDPMFNVSSAGKALK